MEKRASQKIRLGFFVIVGLMIFVLAVYYIGSKQNMFGKTEHLKTVFNNQSQMVQKTTLLNLVVKNHFSTNIFKIWRINNKNQ